MLFSTIKERISTLKERISTLKERFSTLKEWKILKKLIILADLLKINYRFKIIMLEQNIIACFLIHILSTLFNNIGESIISYGM